MGFDSLPSVTTMFEKASAWANPIFQEFQWVIWLSVGIITVVSAIYFIGNKLENGLADIFEHRQQNQQNKLLQKQSWKDINQK